MILIAGTTVRESETKTGERCSQCGQGIVRKEMKLWFTLFFLPIFSIRTISKSQVCKTCNSY